MISCCPSEPSTTMGALAARPPIPYQQPTTDPSGSLANSANWSRNGLPSTMGAELVKSPTRLKQPTLPHGRPSSQAAKSSSNGGASIPGGNALRMLSISMR